MRTSGEHTFRCLCCCQRDKEEAHGRCLVMARFGLFEVPCCCCISTHTTHTTCRGWLLYTSQDTVCASPHAATQGDQHPHSSAHTPRACKSCRNAATLILNTLFAGQQAGTGCSQSHNLHKGSTKHLLLCWRTHAATAPVPTAILSHLSSFSLTQDAVHTVPSTQQAAAHVLLDKALPAVQANHQRQQQGGLGSRPAVQVLLTSLHPNIGFFTS